MDWSGSGARTKHPVRIPYWLDMNITNNKPKCALCRIQMLWDSATSYANAMAWEINS